MKKYLVIIALLLSAFSAKAQISFVQGWIKDNTGKVTECLIRNTENFFANSEIKYKLDPSSDVCTAGINEVSAFCVGDQLYERHRVNVDCSTADISSGYSLTEAPEFEEKTVFLEVLCDGPKRLYLFSAPSYKDNFFISTLDSPEPSYLVNKMYLADGRTGNLRENNSFRGQLVYYFHDNGLTGDEVKDLAYDEKSLVGLFDRMNGTTSRQRRSGAMSIDLAMDYRPAKNGFEAGAGLSFEYVFPSHRNKWAVFFTPMARYYKLPNGDPNELLTCQVTFGPRYYMYLGDNVRLYADAAMGMGMDYFDELTFGFGAKFSDYVSIGMSYTMPYTVLVLQFQDAAEAYHLFEHGEALPIKFTARFSIPLRKGKK